MYRNQEMDNHPLDCESLVCSGTSSSADVTLPITAVLPEAISDSSHASVTGGIISENVLNNNDHDCDKRMLGESDSNFDYRLVTSQSEASCDAGMQCHDAASLMNASTTTAQCLEDVSPSVDSEVHACTPIVVVGGTREEELKRGLEQRLGLVLTKLAREHDEDMEKANDDFLRDDVVNQSGLEKTGEESDTTADMCTDTRHVLVMDIVQEMDEVERYSYISLVAYAMHQLFEFSKWNQYVIFCLLTIQF